MDQTQAQISLRSIGLMAALLLAAYLFIGFGVPALRLARYPLELRQQVYIDAITEFCALPPDVDTLEAFQQRDDWFSGYSVAAVDLPRIIAQGNRANWADVTCIGEALSGLYHYRPGNVALNIAESYGFSEAFAQQLLAGYEASR